MKKKIIYSYALVVTLLALLTGCSQRDIESAINGIANTEAIKDFSENAYSVIKPYISESLESSYCAENTLNFEVTTALGNSLESIPDFTGENSYVIINDNIPFFEDIDITTEIFESYSELDELGRCGVAYANICKDLMPIEPRGEIGHIKPTGWHTVKYNDIIDGNYLYNRCHLIGFQLAGENDNKLNLITGTRFLNIQGMLPFENQVADYVKETENHVLYRVTPIFKEKELVARGVLMEAYSVEDNGEGVQFCIYVYNNQPGIEINYATGESFCK